MSAIAHEPEDVILRDGTTLRLRSPLASDADALLDFMTRLSDRSRYLRFHGFPQLAPKLVAPFLDPDWDERGALIGCFEGRIVALANYARLRDRRAAEVAFTVEDEFQGRGIATRLLERLVAMAAEVGIEEFVAEVLPENRNMLVVFRDAGFDIVRELDGGELEIRFPIAPTEHYREQVAARNHVAVTASLKGFFEPASVAVIGASPRRGSIGGELFRNVLAADFAGSAYPVNRGGDPVAGVHGYTKVGDIPDHVELAVVCLPGEHVLAAVQEALEAGVRAVCVISAGFAEIGAEGRIRQEQLIALVREHGARLVGPNCLGIASANVRLNATFAPRAFPAGNIGFSSQSGALGLAVLERAEASGLGLSAFIVHRQQGRRLLERPARVVGGRSLDGDRHALPRVVRQPARLRAHRAARRADEADPRGEGRDDARRDQGGELPHRRARRLGHRRRRALPPGRRDPDPDARRADRGRVAPGRAARAARPPRRAPDERRRARHPRGRRGRGRGPRAADAERGDAPGARRGDAAGGQHREPGRHARLGEREELPRRCCRSCSPIPGIDAVIVLFVPTVGVDEDEVGAAISAPRPTRATRPCSARS